MEMIEHELVVLENKIKMQIANWKREMNKKDNQFDFYEGRKIEAEVILNWVSEFRKRFFGEVKQGCEETKKEK